MAYLEIEKLTKYFGGLGAVQDLNFEIRKGETLGLVGPNGSGKSTVLNMIGGEFRPSRGRIVFNGEDITGLLAHVVATRGMGRMFQMGGIFPDLTVMDNMLVAGHHRSKVNLWSLVPRLKVGKRGDPVDGVARELLTSVGLADVMGKRAGDLARGKQRFLSLAMLLLSGPPFWMLDEPVSGMTVEEMTNFSNILNKLKKEQGTTFIIVDHNMKMIMENCDRIVVLHYGRKIAEGSPDHISKNPDVIKVYLGGDNATAGG
jgi:branched-chain amino acid transport system ATP-binding protein